MAARALACTVLLAALAWPTLSAAQTAEGEPELMPGWTFTPAVVFGWMHDTNVAMITEGVGQEIQGDMLMVLTPSGALDFLGKRTTFGAGYSGTLRRYRDVNELDSFEQRLRVRLSHRPTARLLVFGRHAFSRLPTTDETELNGVPFRRVGARVNSATGGLEARLTKFTTLRAAYEFVDAAFDLEETLPTFVLGGRSHGFSGDVMRRLSERIAVGGLYEVRFADIKTPLDDRQPLTYQIAGGSSRFTLGPFTTLSFSAGVSTLSDPAADTTNTGPFLRAGATHHFERATIAGGYERSFVPTFGFAASTQTEQMYASLLMPVARNRAYVQASTSWRRNDPLLENEPALTSFLLSTTAGYAIARGIRLEGFFSRAWQDTLVAGGQVNRQRVGVQVVLSTPVRVQ